VPGSALSEQVKKLQRLCEVFCNVATLYLEAKSRQAVDENMMIVGNEFDMYFGALGLMHPDNQAALDWANAAEGQDPSSQMPPMGVEISLGDWFEGNRNIMGLLDGDMPDFDPPDGTP